jgi:hypothetical protein
MTTDPHHAWAGVSGATSGLGPAVTIDSWTGATSALRLIPATAVIHRDELQEKRYGDGKPVMSFVFAAPLVSAEPSFAQTPVQQGTLVRETDSTPRKPV